MRMDPAMVPRVLATVSRPTRAATVLSEQLTGGFSGVVTCDRAKMYRSLGRLQWCWAHLKRDFQALIDHDDGRVKRAVTCPRILVQGL